MDEKIFIKEKKGIPKVVIIVVVALVAGAVGSLLTYFALDAKIDNLVAGNNGTSSSIEYKIQETDSPVVAIAQKAGPSIVGVQIDYVTQSVFGSLEQSSEEGSGIIYSEDGYIITNYHVIESAINNSSAKVYVTLADSDEQLEASIIGSDETTDLAVIKIDKTGLTPAEFGSSSELKVGELAVAIGNPLGQELAGSVTGGYISALNRKLTADGRTYKLIQTDAAINPGNSGGALVNSKGQVIGINTVKIGGEQVEGIGFAIPSDDALPIIKELIANKKIVRPYIGISGINVDEISARRSNISVGVYVAQVLTNSPAQAAGIQRGDVIVGIEGQDITTMEELNEIKNSKKIGDTITLKINRAGKDIEVKVTLASDDTTSTEVTN